jgi:cystathionine beta-lyase
MTYLEGNRDYLYEAIQQHMPGIRMNVPEATYLAWLDCREAGLGDHPADFFEANARVGLNDGRAFGRGGEGFVRLNFGCPRILLEQGIERMCSALEARKSNEIV